MSSPLELVGGGWKGAIAHASECVVTSFQGDKFNWKRIAIPKLLLHHVTALLVMQGMKLQDLFQVDVTLRQVAGGEVFGRGLHLFLAGELSTLHQLPIAIKNVKLAHLEFPLPDISRDDLLREVMGHL